MNEIKNINDIKFDSQWIKKTFDTIALLYGYKFALSLYKICCEGGESLNDKKNI